MAKKWTPVTPYSGDLKTGFNRVIRKMNKELKKVQNGTVRGCLLALIEVRRDMEVTPPLIPLRYGNLRSSAYIITTSTDADLKMHEIRGGTFSDGDPKVIARLQKEHPVVIENSMAAAKAMFKDTGAVLGFSAYYAVQVHEMVGAGFKAAHPDAYQRYSSEIGWRRPGSGPKFFQAALFRNIPKIVTIIYNNARIKP